VMDTLVDSYRIPSYTQGLKPFQMLLELRLGLSKSDVKRIVKKLPLSDSLSALDYMLRNMLEVNG
jgi:hypothetical protein